METFRSNKWPFLWLWVAGSQASPRGALWSLYRFQPPRGVQGLCGWMESAWVKDPEGIQSPKTTGRAAVSWGAKEG